MWTCGSVVCVGARRQYLLGVLDGHDVGDGRSHVAHQRHAHAHDHDGKHLQDSGERGGLRGRNAACGGAARLLLLHYPKSHLGTPTQSAIIPFPRRRSPKVTCRVLVYARFNQAAGPAFLPLPHLLLAGLGRDVSIAHRGDGGEGPVQGGEVLGGQVCGQGRGRCNGEGHSLKRGRGVSRVVVRGGQACWRRQRGARKAGARSRCVWRATLSLAGGPKDYGIGLGSKAKGQALPCRPCSSCSGKVPPALSPHSPASCTPYAATQVLSPRPSR